MEINHRGPTPRSLKAILYSIKYEEFLCPCDSVGMSSWKRVEKEVQQMCLGCYWPYLCAGGRFGPVVIWRVGRNGPELH